MAYAFNDDKSKAEIRHAIWVPDFTWDNLPISLNNYIVNFDSYGSSFDGGFAIFKSSIPTSKLPFVGDMPSSNVESVNLARIRDCIEECGDAADYLYSTDANIISIIPMTIPISDDQSPIDIVSGIRGLRYEENSDGLSTHLKINAPFLITNREFVTVPNRSWKLERLTYQNTSTGRTFSSYYPRIFLYVTFYTY